MIGFMRFFPPINFYLITLMGRFKHFRSTQNQLYAHRSAGEQKTSESNFMTLLHNQCGSSLVSSLIEVALCMDQKRWKRLKCYQNGQTIAWSITIIKFDSLQHNNNFRLHIISSNHIPTANWRAIHVPCM